MISKYYFNNITVFLRVLEGQKLMLFPHYEFFNMIWLAPINRISPFDCLEFGKKLENNEQNDKHQNKKEF